MRRGHFRSDLFYRLNVIALELPSLRDRVDDIPLLVRYLVERYAQKAGKQIRNIQKETLERFQAYDWPGNIRELQNVIERAYITWVLQSEGGNKTRAAEVLGIDPSTLYRKLSRYEGGDVPG